LYGVAQTISPKEAVEYAQDILQLFGSMAIGSGLPPAENTQAKFVELIGDPREESMNI
jgi:hypothetical protein